MIEPDLAVEGAIEGGRARLEVVVVMEMAGGAAMPAAFSKSSTWREAGRLLLPPVRPLNCCALDLQANILRLGPHLDKCFHAAVRQDSININLSLKLLLCSCWNSSTNMVGQT